MNDSKFFKDSSVPQYTQQQNFSPSFLLRMINGISDPIFVKNRQHQLILLNDALCNFIGQSREELIGKSDYDLFPKAEADVFREKDELVFTTGITDENEGFFTDSYGVTHSILTKKCLFEDERGNHFLVGTIRDFTQQKRVEVELAEKASLAALHVEINTAITQGQTIQPILKRCTDALVNHVNAAFARIWTLNTLENVLELQASSGMYTHINGPHGRVTVGMFKIGLIAQERQPHLTNQVLDDPRVGNQEWAKREGMVAFAGYPLILDGNLIGVIAMFARQTLTQSTLDALQLAANEISLGIKRIQALSDLRQQTQELETALYKLQNTQAQLIQSEKMSSLGQLVAGVAHEINNPVSFIYGNLYPADEYTQNLFSLLDLYRKHYPQSVKAIEEFADLIDLDFLRSDLPKLFKSMKMGAERIQGIVLSLRTFSRLDEAEMKAVDIHEGIDSTLMIIQSRLKATDQRPKIEVLKEYGNLPLIECYAQQINQVFLNILVNAIDALEDSVVRGRWATKKPLKTDHPQIYIRTQLSAPNQVTIRIADNGLGIPEDIKNQLFNPFFTTKPVGKGTGMGLAISYQIIIERHSGSIECISQPGVGAEFVIRIPLIQERQTNHT